MRRAPVLPLLVLPLILACCVEAAAEGAPVAPFMEFALKAGETGYTATVTPGEGTIALRLRRDDGRSMADEGHLVPELGLEACTQAGFAYDPGAAAVLDHGAWQIDGGCK